MMWTLFLLLLTAAGIYWAIQQKPRGTPPATEPPRIDNELESARRRLAEIMSTCEQNHAEAVHSLLWLAGSDGTVSRQELRIIISFCERQGTSIEKGWGRALDRLNSGLNISTTGGESGALSNIEALRDRPLPYRIAYAGAAEAIAAANKTSNAAKRRLVAAAHALTEHVTS